MDANQMYDKVKELFPQAVAISASCGVQTGSDGGTFPWWTCTAYATPPGPGSVKIGYGHGRTEAEALAAIIEDAAIIANVPKCGCCGHIVPEPLDMVAFANGILGAGRDAA